MRTNDLVEISNLLHDLREASKYLALSKATGQPDDLKRHVKAVDRAHSAVLRHVVKLVDNAAKGSER